MAVQKDKLEVIPGHPTNNLQPLATLPLHQLTNHPDTILTGCFILGPPQRTRPHRLLVLVLECSQQQLFEGHLFYVAVMDYCVVH